MHPLLSQRVASIYLKHGVSEGGATLPNFDVISLPMSGREKFIFLFKCVACRGSLIWPDLFLCPGSDDELKKGHRSAI